jgi:quinoprotein glucose dehydrogenase
MATPSAPFVKDAFGDIFLMSRPPLLFQEGNTLSQTGTSPIFQEEKPMLPSFRRFVFALLIASLVCALPLIAQYGSKTGDWRVYGGDRGSTRYSPLDQINRENVKDLRVAWTWKSDNIGRPEIKNETTPLMVNGILYFTAGDRRSVVAIDAGTGETLWLWRIDEGKRYEQAPRKNSGRGVAYWADGRDERIVTITPGFQLAALNAKTGAPVAGFGNNGIVDLFTQLDLDFKGDPTGHIGNSSAPLISHDVVVVGPALLPGSRTSKENVKGDIMGFDVRTGKKLWTFHTVPRKGEPGSETWLNGSADYTGNAGAWTGLTADDELGYVYIPVESATGDSYGGHRPGANLYSDSVVCLDIKTGKMVWYQQLVHHDIWDMDISSAPILVDINANGKRIKALAQPTKQAFVYVFDRTTGEPVWPMTERSVAKSDVPNEWTSPTQPFPSKPPAFDLQGLAREDLIDFTPELRQLALQAMESYRMGPLFTPPSLVDAADKTKGFIQVPGYNGGSNWEGGAADPETGFVYIGSLTRPDLVGLVKPANGEFTSELIRDVGSVPTVKGLPLVKPPYGRITAYDMNKGEIAWQTVNGDTPPSVKNHPDVAGKNIPRTGSPSRAGMVVTKTLLFAGEGFGGLPMFRAYDKKTGAIVWEAAIPGGAVQSGLPMTYMHQGRQYIVFSAGDSKNPAQVIAYSLPAARPAAGN